MHSRDLIRKGVAIEKLALLQAWEEGGDLFSETERAALDWAESVTRVAETGVPDRAYEAARAVCDEKQLVDLTIAISLMNAYKRMAISHRNTPQAALETGWGNRIAKGGSIVLPPPIQARTHTRKTQQNTRGQ